MPDVASRQAAYETVSAFLGTFLVDCCLFWELAYVVSFLRHLVSGVYVDLICSKSYALRRGNFLTVKWICWIRFRILWTQGKIFATLKQGTEARMKWLSQGETPCGQVVVLARTEAVRSVLEYFEHRGRSECWSKGQKQRWSGNYDPGVKKWVKGSCNSNLQYVSPPWAILQKRFRKLITSTAQTFRVDGWTNK